MLFLDNARVYRYDAATRRFVRHRNILVENGKIVALDCESPLGAVRHDLDGATVFPAFADCHVHLAGTGYSVGDRDLSRVRSYNEFDSAIAAIPRQDGVDYAGRYDDALWNDGRAADAAPLERYHGSAHAMAVRVDSHSCIVNRTTLAWLDLPNDLPGLERGEDGAPTGRLFLDANWRAQSSFVERFPADFVRDAERRAVGLAHRRGVAHLHAQLIGRTRDGYAEDVSFLRSLPAKIHAKICEPDATLARELGLRTIGGDVFLDGSIGSCTAALSIPYEGTKKRGSLRFSDDALFEYFARAEELGIAAGVHAIGDVAIDQCIRTWRKILGGRPSQTGARHFIEHFEIATDEHIAACAEMNIYLSVQPQFDAAWGDRGGMYDQRLGEERAHEMNAFAKIVRAGGVLCGGADSPVCDLNPLAGMQAAIKHHQPSSRINAHEALAMYTVNAARFGYTEAETGNCEPGLAADLVVLDRDPFGDEEAAASFSSSTVLQTWIDGSLMYDAMSGRTLSS